MLRYHKSVLGPKPAESALVLSYSTRSPKTRIRSRFAFCSPSKDGTFPAFILKGAVEHFLFAPLDAAGEAVAAPQRSEVEHPAGN